jgi:predicted transcriptional regulator
MSEKYAFVMMIQEKWWNEFQRHNRQGRKVHSYVQRGVAPPRGAQLILFYVTKPVAEMAGYAEFIERKVGDAGKLWQEHGSESVLSSKEKYDEFLKDVRKTSFIRIRNLHVAAKPVPCNHILMLLGIKRLSRKGFYINKETADRFIALME